MNYLKVVKILEIKKENPDVKTFLFDYNENTIPGQFFMIWIPGVDEIPMSVSYINKNTKGITFRRIGDATKALFELKEGDKIGIRGPFGNGFKITGKNILFVGGGTGTATIAPAAEEAENEGITTTVILGAKTKKELFFEDRFKKCSVKVLISTDDGSEGFKGFATDILKEIISETTFDSVLTCGPELMMKKLFEICKNIPFQASLERYIKCGIGLCGQCTIGKGLRVCVEGPIFDEKTLKNIEDFGVYKRDETGRKIKF